MCKKGDNEDLLLLCDGCDKGCHTYCHKPKISTIPEGDWYCPSCISKVSEVFHNHFFPHFLLIASFSDRMALFNRQWVKQDWEKKNGSQQFLPCFWFKFINLLRHDKLNQWFSVSMMSQLSGCKCMSPESVFAWRRQVGHPLKAKKHQANK